MDRQAPRAILNRPAALPLPCAAALLLLAAALAAGCHRPVEAALLHQAEELYAERAFDQAIPLVRRYLLDHPADPGAHLLLGMCYLHRNPPALTVALGEFETALHYFGEHGGRGALKEPAEDSRFKGLIHQELALAYLRALYHALEAPAPVPALRRLHEQALANAVRARELHDTGFLRELEETLRDFDGFAGNPMERAASADTS